MTKLPDIIFDRLLKTMLKGVPSAPKVVPKPLPAV